MRPTKAAPGVSARPSAQLGRRELRIGISGWNYKPWRGVFYPAKHPQKRELEFASRALNTIEINGTFYSLQRPSSFQKWYAETPEDFLFAVKKLRDVREPLANFFASGLLALREKLGPILWQFPPNFGWNEKRFREFFAILPRNTAEAAELGRLHNEKLKVPPSLEIDVSRPLADVDGSDDLTFAMAAGGDRLATTHHPSGPQVRSEFLAQQASSLNEQRQVDRLVTHLQLRVIGELPAQPPRDLLR